MSLIDTSKEVDDAVEITTTEKFSAINLKGTVKTAKAAPAKEEPEDDPFGDDDDDLFADDGGAAAAALQEKLKKEAVERAARKQAEGKSMIVLEVKPYEADFDLEKLAVEIKKIKHEGIQNWGAEHKLEKVAFGIFKLVISVIVFDIKISIDDIADLINEKFEDDVQSIDVQAMSKV